MRRHPTISFFLLVAIAAIASYGALVLTSQLDPAEQIANQDATSSITSTTPAPVSPVNTPAIPNTEPVSTVNWEEYTDPTYYLSFKHPANWKIDTFPNRSGYYIIAVRPQQGNDSIRIYISSDDYFGLDGIATKKDTLAGIQAYNSNNMTVGVKYTARYYTFDMGTDLKLQPTFKAMLGTVAFSK